MNNFLKKNLRLSMLFTGLLLVSACSSSSELGESAAPVETADEAQVPAVEASTDVVPAAEPSELAAEPAPDALDANPVIPPPAPEAELAKLDTPSAPAPADLEIPASTTVVEAPVEPSPVTEGDGVHYKVKRGDTLMKIAFENYGDLYRWKEIYDANHDKIKDPSHVPPGTQLTLNGAGMVTIERNGEQYMIKQGDTLGTISHDVYGTNHKWKKLWENNRQLIKDPNRIYAGFYLYYQPEGRLTHDEVPDTTSPSASNAVPAAEERVPASK